MRTASLAVITMLSLLLMGCYDASSSKNDIVLTTPKGYPAPTAINRPSWEEKLAFQTGTSQTDVPQVPLVLAPKEVPPPAPAVAAVAAAPVKKVAARARRSRRGLVRVAHKHRTSPRRLAER